MRRIETIFLGAALGAIPAIAGFMAGWWLSLPFVPESRIWACALLGLALGLAVDALFLKRWVQRAYSLPPLVWVGVYLFYSVGLFGFFMGVPAFHVALAVPAGLFAGAQQARACAAPPAARAAARRVALFTTAVLALVCAASAVVALVDPYTAEGIQHMLGLGFAVTQPMLVGLILAGGLALLALNAWLAYKSAALAYRVLALTP
jgi:hypothetical protein